MAKPISLAQVATRFGKSAGWLRKHVRRLESEHGFPRPIAGFGNIYDPRAIEAWLARQRAPETPIAVADRIEAPDPRVGWTDDQWGELLDQRAALLSAPKGHA